MNSEQVAASVTQNFMVILVFGAGMAASRLPNPWIALLLVVLASLSSSVLLVVRFVTRKPVRS